MKLFKAAKASAEVSVIDGPKSKSDGNDLFHLPVALLDWSDHSPVSRCEGS